MSDSQKPEWLQKAAIRSPWLIFRQPENLLCLGQGQRTREKMSDSYKREGAKQIVANATHRVKFRQVILLETVDLSLSWVTSDLQSTTSFGKQNSAKGNGDNHDPDPTFSENDARRLQREIDAMMDQHEDTSMTPLCAEQRIINLIGKAKKPILGISVTMDRLRTSPRFFQVSYIHICSLTRAITIDVKSCIDGKSEEAIAKHLAGLRRFLLSTDISLNAYHAGTVACRLYKLGLRSRMRDVSMACREYENRELVQVCKTILQNTDLIDMLDPYFVGDDGFLGPHQPLAGLREAYFCAALVQAPLEHSVWVSTKDINDRILMNAIDGMIRTIELPLSTEREARPIQYDEKASGRVRACEDPDTGRMRVEFFKIRCNRLQDLPLPSKREVVEFKLGYHYYTEADTARVRSDGSMELIKRGERRIGLWSEMYGQVFRVSGRDAHVHFPVGIRVHHGFCEVPHEVFLLSRLNQEPAEELQTHQVPDPTIEPRLQILGISIIDQVEPSARDLRTYRLSSLLLQEPPRSQAIDRSDLGRFFEWSRKPTLDGRENWARRPSS